ncbi:MAG: hypothetical protein ABI035_05910 [Gemmatimonadaceae bacterium]
MPLVAFSSLPNDARVWIFGSADELSRDDAATLLKSVDKYLEDWRAHGSPLTAAREWRDNRFLTIGVDQSEENASGCSLDALFRVLQALEKQIGTSLLGNARVYYRFSDGSIRATDRAGFAEQAEKGSIGGDTRVFDLSVQTVWEWKGRFETSTADSWHRALLPAAV